MKNIFNKFAFFIALSFVFISCGNLTTSENDDSIPQGKGKITISTDLQNGRSVLPTAIEEDTEGLKWELEGTCEGKTYSKIWNDTTSEDGVVTTAYNKMKNDNDLLLDVGTWNFTLKVKNNSGYVLFATKEVSIETGENNLSFEMKEATSSDIANGETVATGSIEFTLNFPGDVVTKGIATLTPLAGGNSFTQGFTADAATSNQFLSSITYTNENISAGYYILKIELQQKGDATTPTVEPKTINTYSCLIRVAPGLLSQGKYTLPDLAQLYTITYKLNEGTFDSTTSAVPTSYNAYTSFELPTPTKAGYDFAGWYTDENLQKQFNFDESNKYKITQDTTLYAKWKISWDGLKQQIENNSGISEFVITEDLTATSTITVSKSFKITSDKNVTITRGNSIDGAIFKDAFFKVESAGNLELEGTENITITLDGGNANESPILATAPLITSSGNLTLTNCILQNNTNNTDYDGGGGVYISGESSIFTMTGGEISGNSAYYGGGVYISGESSIFTMTGGEISGNSAEYGGGVATIGKFSMSGGTISGNKVTNNGNGSGVYVAYYSGTIEYVGTFEMSGGAYVDSSNDVYLANGTTVTVAADLSKEFVATITLPSYNVGTPVITAADDNVILADKVGKFTLKNENYKISDDGSVAQNSGSSGTVTGTPVSDFSTLQTNIANALKDGTVTELYLTNDINMTEYLNIDSGQNIVLKTNGNYSIYRGSGFTGSFFTVNSGATFKLGNDDGIYKITLDGRTNSSDTEGLSASYPFIKQEGTLTVSNCIMQYNKNGGSSVIGGAIYSTGTTTITNTSFMYNANTLESTTKGFGGAIYLLNDGNATISNCTFENNTTYQRGGAIYIGGSTNSNTVITVSGSTFKNNIATYSTGNGGAICVSSMYGTVSLTSLTCSDNYVNNANPTSEDIAYRGSISSVTKNIGNISCANIYIDKDNTLNVIENINNTIKLTISEYVTGSQIINFNNFANKANFTLSDANYTISDEGTVVQNSGGV